MQVPLHIKFHGVDPSPYLEQRIREHVTKLETLCDRITRCEVVVELPHLHHRHGKQFHIRIDLSIPGHEIVVSRDPGIDEAHEDPYVAVRDAFLAARRQLEEHLRKVRDEKVRAQDAS
jgi:ribosome-associated translation inhibitor RaiA